MKKRVLYGLQYESLKEKIKWMLSLSLKERYEYNLDFAAFISQLRKKDNLANVRKASKTVQILKF